MNQNFLYSDGLFNLNTLSPSSEYYYKIRKPKSINMSNFGAEIAFFSVTGELIYYNKATFAHWLQDESRYEFVLWSDTGNELVFYEYLRDKTYDLIFLDLNSKTYIKFDYRKHESVVSKYLINGFSFNEVFLKTRSLQIPSQPAIRDAFTNSFTKPWYPK